METLKETEAKAEGGLGVGEPGGSVSEPERKDKDRVVYDLNEEGGDNTVVVVNRTIVVTETTTVEMRYVSSDQNGSQNVVKENNSSDVSVEGNEINGNGSEDIAKENNSSDDLVEENEFNGNGSENIVEENNSSDDSVEGNEFNGNGGSRVVDVHVSFDGVNENDAEEQVMIRVDEGLISGNGATLVEDSGEMIKHRRSNRGVKGNVAEDLEKVDEGFTDDGEIVGDKKHDFAVGDFVWGKIKSHPWWPGQVYDPSDVSEFASKFKHEDQLLVAYFGDGSCAWCFPDQLVPFGEHFEEMSKQRSNSRTFYYAVKNALDEIGRRVELKMLCSCVAVGDRVDLARPLAANAGVKPGVLVPEGDIGRLATPKYEPAEILQYVKRLAQAGSVTNMLQLVLVKSWLSAFYRVRRGSSLPMYHDPHEIEGLEDKSENMVLDTNDFSVPNEVPTKGPLEEECHPSPKASPEKGPAISGEKLIQSRKLKSVAELMGKDTNVKPKSQRKSNSEEEMKKKKRAKLDAEIESTNPQASTTTGRRGRKKKSEISAAANEGVQLEEKVDETPLSNKRKENEDLGGSMDREKKDESEKSHMSRERKKSKYLSPPYTTHSWNRWNFYTKREQQGSASEKITKIARVGERMTKAAERLISSPPLSNCNGEASEVKMPSSKLDKSGKSPRIIFENEKKIIESKDVDASVNEVLSEVRCAALNLMSLEDSSLEMIKGFVTAFRSSMYLNGSNYKSYHKQQATKNKSLVPELGNLGDDVNPPQPPIHKETIERPRSRVTKLKKAARATSTNKKSSPVSLIVTFTPGASFPSKDEIIKIFSKYGNVKEDETEVSLYSNSAQVAYTSISDAEEAFRECIKQSPLGAASTGYRLSYSSASARALESGQRISTSSKKRAVKNRVGSQVTADMSSQAGLIREKLEMLKSTLEMSEGKISSEERSSLESEMRSLLQKVSGLAVKTSS